MDANEAAAHTTVDDDHLISVKEFCKRMGISHAYFYRLLKEGRVETVKVGPCRRIPVREQRRISREGC